MPGFPEQIVVRKEKSLFSWWTLSSAGSCLLLKAVIGQLTHVSFGLEAILIVIIHCITINNDIINNT